jgi:1-acyl-sn-glycerol-3-phosphate acyltransferase
MKKNANTLVFLFLTYPIGVLLGILFLLLRLLGRIKVIHPERFPRWQKKLIVVSNHPSVLETFLLPFLFFPEYCLRPFTHTPWSTPDKKLFYDRWFLFWARPRLIPINRGDKSELAISVVKIKKILDQDGVVILFPEGGRTFKGNKFVFSKTGKRIRELETGIGWLIRKTGALVVPIWVEGTNRVLPNAPGRLFVLPNLRGGKITIRIGRPLLFQKNSPYLTKEEVTQIIASVLIDLADEEE